MTQEGAKRFISYPSKIPMGSASRRGLSRSRARRPTLRSEIIRLLETPEFRERLYGILRAYDGGKPQESKGQLWFSNFQVQILACLHHSKSSGERINYIYAISKFLDSTTGRVGHHLDRLAARGFIEAVPSESRHSGRQRKEYVLTDEGLEVCRRLGGMDIFCATSDALRKGASDQVKTAMAD